MSDKDFRSKAISAMTDIQSVYEHSCALTYADDSEKVSYHLFWVKWYLKRFNESLSALEDVGF